MSQRGLPCDYPSAVPDRVRIGQARHIERAPATSASLIGRSGSSAFRRAPHLSNGVLDRMTWHCSGLADFTNGVGQSQGFCAGHDPVGDQVVFNWESEKHAPEQKVVRGTFSWTGGTGKYAGIRGDGTYVD